MTQIAAVVDRSFGAGCARTRNSKKIEKKILEKKNKKIDAPHLLTDCQRFLRELPADSAVGLYAIAADDQD